MNVEINFIHYEWDNYQGAQGKVFKRRKIIELDKDIKLSNIKNQCIHFLNQSGFIDTWNVKVFTGSGLISIVIL